jgi:NitT/TauT family transport system permease protein
LRDAVARGCAGAASSSANMRSASACSRSRLTLIYCSAGAFIGEMIAAQSGLGLLVQTFSGRFDIASVMALILVVAFMVMALTSVMDLAERRLLAWSKGSTDVPG